VIDRMSGRVALLLVVVALILVFLLGWFVLVAPQTAKASKLTTQVDETNVQLQAVTSLLEGPIGRQSRASLLVSKIAVPDDAKVSQILRQLSAAASSAGVELDSLAPQPLVPTTGAEVLPITMNVKGRYFAMQSFLHKLRTEAGVRGDKIYANGRLYTVDSIQFTGQAPTTTTGQTGGSTPIVSAAVALNAFLYSPTAVAGAPTTTDTGTTTTTTP
jgi:hypothetical protein